MAAVQKLMFDYSARSKPQLLKNPVTTIQAALTAAQLCQTIDDLSVTRLEMMDVSIVSGLRLEVVGTCADTITATLNLYGWYNSGPGKLIGTLTPAFGGFTMATAPTFFANADVHNNLVKGSNVFSTTTAYRGCDTYTATADYEGALNVFAGLADFPNFAEVSFANSQYDWFGIGASAIGDAGVVGVICRAIGIKSQRNSIDGE